MSLSTVVAMKQRRFNFADDYESRKAPVGVWLPRALITGLIAGLGTAAYLLGYLHS